MQEQWTLKHTSHINQMLRVKENVKLNGAFKTLLVVKHQYHVADDIMFPDPACLAFFTAFEENHLALLEQNNRLQLVAVDIFEGVLQFYIYCEDGQQTVYACIDFLKSNPLYTVEFEIKPDASQSFYTQLLN